MTTEEKKRANARRKTQHPLVISTAGRDLLQPDYPTFQIEEDFSSYLVRNDNGRKKARKRPSLHPLRQQNPIPQITLKYHLDHLVDMQFKPQFIYVKLISTLLV
jgi:hypothetical protein